MDDSLVLHPGTSHTNPGAAEPGLSWMALTRVEASRSSPGPANFSRQRLLSVSLYSQSL